LKKSPCSAPRDLQVSRRNYPVFAPRKDRFFIGTDNLSMSPDARRSEFIENGKGADVFFAGVGGHLYSKVWFNTPQLCCGSNKATLAKIWY
jgi:hypothetical protein